RSVRRRRYRNSARQHRADARRAERGAQALRDRGVPRRAARLSRRLPSVVPARGRDGWLATHAAVVPALRRGAVAREPIAIVELSTPVRRACGGAEVWTCGGAEVRRYGSVDVWTCGGAEVWTC